MVVRYSYVPRILNMRMLSVKVLGFALGKIEYAIALGKIALGTE